MAGQVEKGRRYRPLSRAWQFISSFAADQKGATQIIVMVSLPVLLGMAGLAFDGALLFMEKRQNQGIADHVALAATVDYTRTGGDLASATEAANAAAARNGFELGGDRSVVVNELTNCGPGGATANCIEVLVTERQQLYLSQFIGNSTIDVQARAVSALMPLGEACLLALDTSMPGALEFSGSADAGINCGVASNSSSMSSIIIKGKADLSADPAVTVGDIDVQGAAELNSTSPPVTHAQPTADPYAGISVPMSAGCDYTDKVASVDQVLGPGTYCGGLTITDSANVTLQPGVYIIDAGDLVIEKSAIVTGNEVTFFFTATDPYQIGGVLSLKSLNPVTLTAPGVDGHSTGPYAGEFAGLLFVQDPDASFLNDSDVLISNKFTGGGTMTLNGGLYFPNQAVEFFGNASAANGCIKIVARKITVSGNASISNDPQACEDLGVGAIMEQLVRLAE